MPFGFTATANTVNGGLLCARVGTSDGPDSWSSGSTYRTSATLDADHPGGSYVVRFHTVHDGDMNLVLRFATSAFPNAPLILGFQAAQAVVSTADLSLTWTAFDGGSTTDIVRLPVSTSDAHVVFKNRGYGKSGALNGTSPGTWIPAGTLASGQVHAAGRFFARGIGQHTGYGQ